MTLSFSTNINEEVQKAHLAVVDLIQVDFGGGLERRWSTVHVPRTLAAGLSGDYEARIVEIGTRRWSLGADDDSVTLIIGNADDAIRNFARAYGIDIFDGARVRHHRFFPSIKEIYKDYWVGKGTALTFGDHTAEWEVRFGLGALKQRALRRFQRNCTHVFAGGPGADCPYSPEQGFGVPRAEVFGTAAAGTNDETLQDDSANAFAAVYAGMLAYNRSKNCVSRILSVVSVNELTLSEPVAGAGTGDPAGWLTGDSYVIGPPHTSCDKTRIACDTRGMNGPSDRNPEGLMDERSYFGGSNDVANVSFSGRVPDSNDRFTRRTLGNDSFDGKPIPVIFGRVKIYGRESIAHAPAGDFQHGMFILGEGQIWDITTPLVNDKPPDNANGIGDVKKENNFAMDETAISQSDPFIKFGTWFPRGIDDNRVTTVDAELAQAIARHVRGCIGRRASVSTSYGYNTLDSYFYRDGGEVVANPHLFVDAIGGGLSMHGLCGARVRIETNEDNQSVLDGDFTIIGLITPLPAAMSNNTEDSGRLNIPQNVAGVDALKYTISPNPIQAAYAFLLNNRWGAGLSELLLHLDSFLQESAYCEELIIPSAVARQTRLMGDVNRVPQPQPPVPNGRTNGDPEAAERRGQYYQNSNQYFTHSLRTTNPNSSFKPQSHAQSLDGREVIFNPYGGGETQRATIQSAEFFKDARTLEETYPNMNLSPDPDPVAPATPTDQPGYLVTLDRFVPEPGADFIVLPPIKRFKANGILADNTTVVEMFQSILDNCHGIFRMNAGQVEVLIKKALSPTEIDTIVRDHLFTDRGANRNIIYNENGSSSLKVWREYTEDVVNEYSVEFLDSSREYHTSRVVVYDDNAQVKAANKLGEEGDRRRIVEEIQLYLTTGIDQAKRILSLRARESVIQNLFCSFSTSLKNGMRVQPGDIIAIDSNKIVGLFNTQLLNNEVSFGDAFLFRILEKVESAAYVIDFNCQLHVNSLYSDIVRDFGDLFRTPTSDPKVGVAENVTPLDPEEDTFVDQYGQRRSHIRVAVTYPPPLD